MVDINERAKEVCIGETTSRERIRTVLDETTEYATAAEIADRALTSEPTTRKYLEELVADGIGVTTQDGRTTRYKRQDGRRVDEHYEELWETTLCDELIDGIQEMKVRLQEFRDTYEAEGPEELAIELNAGGDGWGTSGAGVPRGGTSLSPRPPSRSMRPIGSPRRSRWSTTGNRSRLAHPT